MKKATIILCSIFSINISPSFATLCDHSPTPIKSSYVSDSMNIGGYSFPYTQTSHIGIDNTSTNTMRLKVITTINLSKLNIHSLINSLGKIPTSNCRDRYKAHSFYFDNNGKIAQGGFQLTYEKFACETIRFPCGTTWSKSCIGGGWTKVCVNHPNAAYCTRDSKILLFKVTPKADFTISPSIENGSVKLQSQVSTHIPTKGGFLGGLASMFTKGIRDLVEQGLTTAIKNSLQKALNKAPLSLPESPEFDGIKIEPNNVQFKTMRGGGNGLVITSYSNKELREGSACFAKDQISK